jgi:hypothetical protein
MRVASKSFRREVFVVPEMTAGMEASHAACQYLIYFWKPTIAV